MRVVDAKVTVIDLLLSAAFSAGVAGLVAAIGAAVLREPFWLYLGGMCGGLSVILYAISGLCGGGEL